MSAIEVTDLIVRDTALPKLTRNIFTNFKNIHTLVLDNTKTEEIEEDAFYDLGNLKNLYIVNNHLSNFSSTLINPNSSLIWLDISNNSITTLTNLNVTAIPSLTVLNISHNSLEYLPKDILDKLELFNQFYIIVDGNPWNCFHEEWKEFLSKNLVEAFCLNDTAKQNNFSQLQQVNISSLYTHNCSSNVFKTACGFWIFGSLWLGIILGNISKLKKLLFHPYAMNMEDKAIQCGNYNIIFVLFVYFISRNTTLCLS